jgi:hypothetical protein
MAAPTPIRALPRELSGAEERLIAASNRFGLSLFREVERTSRATVPRPPAARASGDVPRSDRDPKPANSPARPLAACGRNAA